MKNGRYILVLAVLTAFLFGISHWLTPNKPAAHRQTQKASPEEQKNRATQKKSRPGKEAAKSSRARIVTLYPAGSLSIRKAQPVEKPPVKKAIASGKAAEPIQSRSPKNRDIPYISRSYKGDRPTLEVGYEDIGFERYIEVMERVGRLFVLIDAEGRVQLGPEVSFKRRTVIGDRGIQGERYAVDRPHLIADPFIEERLTELDLPAAALRDRVVLVFNNPFDNLIWDVIGSVAASKNLTLANIARVSGNYIKRGNGIFLQLTRAVVKDTLKELPFSRSIMVVL